MSSDRQTTTAVDDAGAAADNSTTMSGTHPSRLSIGFAFYEADPAEAASERAVRLGAVHLQAAGGYAGVYADPAGHTFCL